MTEPATPSTDDLALLEDASRAASAMTDAIGQTIVGQSAAVRSLLAAVFAEGHVLVVGVPGLAKTLLVKTLAQTLGFSFNRIQFTPDMMPADITGTEMLQTTEAGRREMQFIPGPIFANLVLADEINRTAPKTQSALLEAMQEAAVTAMGRSHAIERPFLVVATQNPIEQEGTYPLPEAQLDRFMFSLEMDYPSETEERAIVTRAATADAPVIEPCVTVDQLRGFQHLLHRIPTPGHVVDEVVRLVRGTRPSESPDASIRQYVQWGAGPRAGQHLIVAAQALAMIDGEPAVSVAHVHEAAPVVLPHRVITNFHADADSLRAVDLVRRLIAT